MKKIENTEGVIFLGGDKNCDFTTGVMCQATAFLLFSGPFAPLAAATGVGCALGIYSGCY